MRDLSTHSSPTPTIHQTKRYNKDNDMILRPRVSTDEAFVADLSKQIVALTKLQGQTSWDPVTHGGSCHPHGIRHILKKAGVTEGNMKHFFDFGGGLCVTGVDVARNYPSCQVHCVEVDDARVRAANKLKDRYGLENLNIYQNNLKSIICNEPWLESLEEKGVVIFCNNINFDWELDRAVEEMILQTVALKDAMIVTLKQSFSDRAFKSFIKEQRHVEEAVPKYFFAWLGNSRAPAHIFDPKMPKTNNEVTAKFTFYTYKIKSRLNLW